MVQQIIIVYAFSFKSAQFHRDDIICTNNLKHSFAYIYLYIFIQILLLFSQWYTPLEHNRNRIRLPETQERSTKANLHITY